MRIRVFLSYPMHGLTDEELFDEKDRLEEEFKKRYAKKFAEAGIKIEFVDHYNLTMPVGASPSWYLAQDIERLGTADIIFFGKDYQKATGCMIEFLCAMKFGVLMLYEINPTEGLDFSFFRNAYLANIDARNKKFKDLIHQLME